MCWWYGSHPLHLTALLSFFLPSSPHSTCPPNIHVYTTSCITGPVMYSSDHAVCHKKRNWLQWDQQLLYNYFYVFWFVQEFLTYLFTAVSSGHISNIPLPSCTFSHLLAVTLHIYCLISLCNNDSTVYVLHLTQEKNIEKTVQWRVS